MLSRWDRSKYLRSELRRTAHGCLASSGGGGGIFAETWRSEHTSLLVRDSGMGIVGSASAPLSQLHVEVGIPDLGYFNRCFQRLECGSWAHDFLKYIQRASPSCHASPLILLPVPSTWVQLQLPTSSTHPTGQPRSCIVWASRQPSKHQEVYPSRPRPLMLPAKKLLGAAEQLCQ